MASEPQDFFLFLGSADSESATTRLRASGGRYHKKLLNSRPENWRQIIGMVTSPHNQGTLVTLTGYDYMSMCRDEYEAVTRDLLDALVGCAHVIFVHEAVFLTDEQRDASDSEHVERANLVNVTPRFTDEDRFGMPKEEFFGDIPDSIRQKVNTTLRDRELNVIPYRTNVERSIIASGFVEDHERHLLFRIYVPSGRLYAQEAETLLGLFRDWLGQTGHSAIRQEGYSTNAGQVFEFFSAEGEPVGGMTRYFRDFSDFLDTCVSSPEAAISRLTVTGVNESVATRIVTRFATQARRLSLDLKQRREERVLGFKHQFENVLLEVEGLQGDVLESVIDELLPLPTTLGIVLGPDATVHRGGRVFAADSVEAGASGDGGQPPSLTVNNFHQQFINEVAGSVVQNVQGTANLGPEARQLMDQILQFGGNDRDQLQTAVHELEDDGARGTDRLAARGRLKRFLADLGNRGLGIGLEVLQKYVEHKVGVS